MPDDVVVIGGGPNGLLLAIELALGGVRPTVLEQHTERPSILKANGLVGRVVQAMDYRGLHESLGGGPRPVRMPGFQFGAVPLKLSDLADHDLYMLPIPQLQLEKVLAERAAELGIIVHKGHTLRSIDQDADHVTAEIVGPQGKYTLTTRYLVGADGGSSIVRKQLGIGFPGITDDTFVSRSGQVAITAPMATGDGSLEIPGVGLLRPRSFTRTDNGLFAYGMFQPGVFRVSALEWGGDPLPENENMPLSELRDAVKRVLGTDVPMTEPADAPSGLRRLTGINSRQAEHYRRGRVFLVGDAAHVHSGIGGPGLNLGMQDALNLGWKLAATVRGWAPPDLLDTYESERHPVGQRVIMQTRAQMALTVPDPNITALRDLMTELLADKPARQHLADLMAGADVHYETTDTHPMSGRWLPDLPLDNGKRVADLMRTGRPLLLDFSNTAEAVSDWSDRVDVVTTTTNATTTAILVRPDGYVAWASDNGVAGLEDALRAWFGEPSSKSHHHIA
ncbi:FAD-dependent monooxygenase [Actinophytocola sp.]|uniref:FAD-dependent monooxygenase n=1 Tax=Actinophytocola sp. TaxID=1872138 RepID=UPI002D3519B6|nr:FAD-dependent monooxygenase [Actinophytocola sp.]HYQ65268.1 FAD-dependent monooxygenase [Actinophytocola sp.]